MRYHFPNRAPRKAYAPSHTKHVIHNGTKRDSRQHVFEARGPEACGASSLQTKILYQQTNLSNKNVSEILKKSFWGGRGVSIPHDRRREQRLPREQAPVQSRAQGLH